MIEHMAALLTINAILVDRGLPGLRPIPPATPNGHVTAWLAGGLTLRMEQDRFDLFDECSGHYHPPLLASLPIPCKAGAAQAFAQSLAEIVPSTM